MSKRSQHFEDVTSGQASGWVRYQPGLLSVPDDERWLGLLGLRSFRMLLWAAIVAIAALILRNVLLFGAVPWADVGTLVLTGFVLWLLSKKPEWCTPLSWIILAALFLDVLDGLSPWTQPIMPTHLLMPILVLYGALLCDIAITSAAALGVLGLCVLTWFKFTPLSIGDKMMLSNVVLATLISGLTALGVWMHHKRLMREFRQQAERLRLELDTNNRLNAVIFHDISNPLAALVGKIELAQLTGKVETFDLSVMSRMVSHIASIIRIVRAINSSSLDTVLRETVTTDRMAEDLLEVFSARLAIKKQTLSLTSGSGLSVKTIYDVLLNSVLANLLSNAMKFSPPGSNIEMRAAGEGKNLRIEIRDQGGGFPPDLLLRGGRLVNVSSVGTAGETGFGLGLDIVALYVSKLGGVLEIMNRPEGGGAASVVLPMESI
jgi:signal transduction histidine kinase